MIYIQSSEPIFLKWFLRKLCDPCGSAYLGGNVKFLMDNVELGESYCNMASSQA